MKRCIAIFLTFILIFNFSFISFSYATSTFEQLEDVKFDDEVSIEEIEGEGELGTLGSSNPTTSSGYSPNGFVGQLISWCLAPLQLITLPLQAVVFIMPSIDGCIFNTTKTFKLSFFEENPDGLAGNLQGAISGVYNAFRYLVTAAYVVVLVYLAIRMMLSSVGRQKAHYKELFRHWLIGLLLLFSFHWVMAFIIWLSNTFVDILAGISKNLLDDSNMLLLAKKFFPNLDNKFPVTTFIVSRISGATDGGLASLFNVIAPIIAPIFFIIFIKSTFSIIVTYFRRLFTIAVLIIIFPIVALSYVFDKIGDRKAQTLSLWLKEFMVNVMVQPIHALILVFISLLFSTGISDLPDPQLVFGTSIFGPHILGAVMSLTALRLIPVGEELLKKLFQISASMGPGSQGIAGSMAKAGMAFQGTKHMASELGKGVKGVMAFGSGQRKLHKLWKDSETGKDFQKNRNWLQRRFGATKRAKEKWLSENSDGKAAYDNYKSEVCEKLGTKDLDSARKKTKAMAYATAAGVGTALTGASSGKFLSTATTSAAAGIALVDSASKAIPLIFGDAKSAKDFEDRAQSLAAKDIDKMTPDDKKKIAAELGISINQVTSGNKDALIQSYKNMAIAKKYGTDDAHIKNYSVFHAAEKNREKGLLPDGSGPMDIKEFDKGSVFQTKDGLYGTYKGTIHKISNEGNSQLKDGEKRKLGTDIKNKSVKEIMKHENNAEYNSLENERAAISEDLSATKVDLHEKTLAKEKAKAEFDDKRTARKNIKKSWNVAKRALDSANTTFLNSEKELRANAILLQQSEVKLQEAEANYNANSSTENLEALQKIQSENTTLKANVNASQQRFDTAKQQYSTAQAKFDKIDPEMQVANQEFEAAFKDYDSASKAYTASNSRVSELNSRTKQIDSKMSAIEEKTISSYLAADEIQTKFGGDPIFTETVLKHVQDGTYQNTEFGVQVDDNGTAETFVERDGQRYTIKTQENSELQPGSITRFSPEHYGREYTAAQASYVQYSADAQAQRAHVEELQNNNAPAEQIQAAEQAATLADNNAKKASNEIGMYNLFNDNATGPIIQDQFSYQPEEVSSGFMHGECQNVIDFLDKHKDKEYSISLKRSADSLIYKIFDKNNNEIEPRNGDFTIPIDGNFNCPELENAGDSITIIHKKNNPKDKNDQGAWYIKKKK